jgi:lipid-A-disaccharide synthase
MATGSSSSTRKRLQILISAGEASGDLHAARLVSALRTRIDADFFGMGGPRMAAAGVQIIVDCGEVAVVGLAEAVGRIPTVFRALAKLEAEARRREPILSILVDSWGIHGRLARRLKKSGFRLVYFISPQVWAWRPGRVRAIRSIFEKVLVIFPFEEKFYESAGAAAEFVGNPLVDEVVVTQTREQFASRHGLDATKRVVTLLPGSRHSELRHHVPVLAETMEKLASDGDIQFVVAAAAGMPLYEFEALRIAAPVVRIVENDTYNALAAADCCVVASGSATVEAALVGAPFVVIYRLSRLTAAVARRLVRTPYVAMVNLIAGRKVVPELIQEECTAENVTAEVRRMLADPSVGAKMREEFRQVRAKLGPAGAIERTASAIASLLGQGCAAKAQ